MTTVKVEYYKNTGKWYTSAEFETDTDVWESQELEKEIESRGTIVSKMSYTYEAESENGINKRIVIKQ